MVGVQPVLFKFIKFSPSGGLEARAQPGAKYQWLLIYSKKKVIHLCLLSQIKIQIGF